MFNEIDPVSNGNTRSVHNQIYKKGIQKDEKKVNEKTFQDMLDKSMRINPINKENQEEKKTANFDQLAELKGIPPVFHQLSSMHNNEDREKSICELDKDTEQDSTSSIENRDEPANGINQVDEEPSVEPQDDGEDIHEKEPLCEVCMKEQAVYPLKINGNLANLCKACYKKF
ncbi:hypothetical protein [Planococcus maitriensis]|uniref:Uncharacterized protein n=1 Tax=Planococcus maitriensis TaxID=221799 RepID=A0A365KAG3_9BACL|nr:hypothetical protein [Planococcus maitriensis]RAZ69644.1 hypothetical protein DP119_03020 [Planococcus maitriensis]